MMRAVIELFKLLKLNNKQKGRTEDTVSSRQGLDAVNMGLMILEQLDKDRISDPDSIL